ncbi:MAG: transcription elongation factor GreA [Candidatus Enteromonas sp.]|jgi:transcription elongation factor GreA|nr:transcription elongation factor GreA [Bacilli bacterium]MEE3299074.1 transcription elongation factor GreA [Candidatus Enteromonas sp.]MBQ2052869.1 transcription elongation factor GreA [Bacilli bacterium]MBQ4182880.1 transcription elongation factor GreA [Bacilli bacterium]MEE3401998.1 transcription elongation factor GreA [Candidatus Enteromonas sp.]
MAEDKMILTQEGYKKLQEEYRNLIDVERPDVIQAIKEARAQGDLSENSEYDAARDRQAKVESRITEIEHIFDVAIVVDSSSEGEKAGKKIYLENFVTYRDLSTNEVSTVKLVSTIEADPFAEPFAYVSNESALGKAIMGQVPGSRVPVESPDPYEIEIIKASKEAPVK